MSNDWLPSREQDFMDLCHKWKTGLENPANLTIFALNQADVTAVLGAVDAFLTARAAYEDDDSSKNRLAKDECPNACGVWAQIIHTSKFVEFCSAKLLCFMSRDL
jgi:hypothetical protein